MDIPSSEVHLQAQTVPLLALGNQHTSCGLKFIIVTVLIMKTLVILTGPHPHSLKCVTHPSPPNRNSLIKPTYRVLQNKMRTLKGK